MKKFLLSLLLVFTLSAGILTGCGNSSTSSHIQVTDSSRTVRIEQLGLQYTLPEGWEDLYNSNIYIETIEGEDIFCRVTFDYITTDNYQLIADGNPNYDLSKMLNPVCEIAIIETDKIDGNAIISSHFTSFGEREIVGTQGDYTYYFLWDSKSEPLEPYTDKEQALLSVIKAYVKDLKNSIETFEFDPNALAEFKNRAMNTISFSTQTLEGEDINSTVFGGYDLTMIHFWGSYATEYDESQTMQDLYTKLQTDMPNVNLIEAVIDTPDEEANQAALEAKQRVNGQYTSIMLDQTLANWVTNNMVGVPTTIFVNTDGTIVGEAIQGTKSLDEYIAEIENRLETANQTDATSSTDTSEESSDTDNNISAE